jgi:DNA-binding MarR family transcriptional regulator
MQASVTAPTVQELAESLAELWRRVAAGGDQSRSFALVDELGISLTQMKSLMLLQHCGDPLSVGELSERLPLSLPAASRTVDGLLRRGWIERREDERDRRCKRVTITPAGRDVAERISDARLQGLEAFAASLTDDQRAGLHAAIAEL